MPFKFSRCICLQSPDADKAMQFYHTTMGLPVAHREDSQRELTAEQNRMFFDTGEPRGPIMEFLVPDLEQARRELLAAGCTVVRWEGKGGCCYMADPFGFWFNLWEEPEAFAETSHNKA